MAKLKAIKNISNRPLELVFDNGTERIPPREVGKFHKEADWKGSLAEKQANEFIKRREAKFVEKSENEVQTGEVAEQPTTEPEKQTQKATNKK